MSPRARPKRRRVVVDGSNIATEGRSAPSLAQLDEAIRTFLDENQEFTTSDVTVVVDATFGHRIDASERADFQAALDHGEMLTPPAGAIGRGDGFILRIADKSDAVVLSNDSFQEFQADRPWLFDPGRLIGGKPVPGVGWVFTPRTPVRALRARGAAARTPTEPEADLQPETELRTELGSLAPVPSSRARRPADAGVAARAKTANTKSSRARTLAVTEPAAAAGRPRAATRARGATAAAAGTPSSLAKAPAKAGSARKAVKRAAKEPAAARAKEPAAARAKEPAAARDAIVPGGRATRAKSAGTKRTVGAGTRPRTAQAAPAAGASATPPPRQRAKGASPSGGGATRAGTAGKEAGGGSRRSGANDTATFRRFVGEHPLGDVVEGTVTAFTSHGAHVDVDGTQCHVPLRGLGDPPPQRARQVLAKGERRPFRLVSVDTARRRAELALAPGATAPR